MISAPAPSAASPDAHETDLSLRPARTASGRGVSRRAIFSGLAASLAGFTPAAAASPPASIGDPDPSDLRTRLVRRLCFGINEFELNQVRTLGYSAYLEYHLNHTAIADPGMSSILAPLATLNLSPSQLHELPPNQVLTELIDATLQRAFYSRRQLFERMVEFWTDHFNIDINIDACQWLKTVDDRSVIRANALGKFPDLLIASAQSPAMLYFLDNTLSVAGAPNENYARELMELHTLGVNGGYTQQDVREVARCLTGWGVHPFTAAPSIAGTFYFDASKHDDDAKIVLGHVIPAGGGIQDGLRVLDILSHHPSTARFVARKLCARFLGDGLPPSIINSVASVYTATGGDIASMLRRVLLPQHLAQASPKYKRPMHAYVSALRAGNGRLLTTGNLRSQLLLAGHLPFNWGPPDGYPDSVSAWSGLLLPRWNYGAMLTNGNLPGLVIDTAAYFAGLTSADQMVDRIDATFFGGEMLPGDRAAVRAYLLPDPGSLSRQRDAIGLAIGSPGFQWY